jgi:peroxiredoxin
MLAQSSDRLQDLEQQFQALEPKLPASPEKDAISVLHAILLESRRLQWAGSDGSRAGTGAAGRPTLDDVANLYKSAPGMEGAAENTGLPAGVAAPDFSLPDANGRPVSLAEFRGKNVVLVFYPLDWSPACSDQLSLYHAELAEFKQYNTQLIGVSVDSLYSHGAWAAVRGITFPLLADFNPKGEVARRYHVWRESSGFSERALYLIDGDGIIRYAHVSPALAKVPDIYELFEQLRTVADQAARQKEPVSGG